MINYRKIIRFFISWLIFTTTKTSAIQFFHKDVTADLKKGARIATCIFTKWTVLEVNVALKAAFLR